MSDELSPFSVIIAWQYNDIEQGHFFTAVLAKDEVEAEAFARQEMKMSEPDNDCDGPVIDIQSGVTWKARDYETALQSILEHANKPDSDTLIKIKKLANNALKTLNSLPKPDEPTEEPSIKM